MNENREDQLLKQIYDTHYPSRPTNDRLATELRQRTSAILPKSENPHDAIPYAEVVSPAPHPLPRRFRWQGSVVAMVTVPLIAAIFAYWVLQGTPTAYGLEEVALRLKQVKTVRFHETTTMPDGRENTVKVSILSPNKRRNVDPQGGETVMDVHQGKMLMLNHFDDIARFHSFEAMPDANLVRELIDPLAALTASESATPIESVERLQPKLVKDIMAFGLQARFRHKEYKSDVVMDIWTDPKTKLPVLIESRWDYTGELSDEEKKQLKSTTMTVVLKDFEFDVDLDPDEFKLVVPDGFREAGKSP